MAHPGLPRAEPRLISKTARLELVTRIDKDRLSTERVLRMENGFRDRVQTMFSALPIAGADFTKFNTNPFVLLFYASQGRYSRISEIEESLVPAKVFSSMETAAGKMVEDVVLPVYGWTTVASRMHSPNSVLDARRLEADLCRLVTLKSGPRVLNDDMSENIADAVIVNSPAWATESGRRALHFTYGVLYGTPRQSNKKDWHILRNIADKLGDADGAIVRPPWDQWSMNFAHNGIDIEVSIKIGTDWWEYLGGGTCALEVMLALIRSCIQPGTSDSVDHAYRIPDLGSIVTTAAVADGFNAAIMQRSQIPWLFLVARHLCDQLVA